MSVVMLPNKNKTFVTQNLALAAALQACSTAKLHSIDLTSSGGRATFVFDTSHDTDFEKKVDLFWSKNLLIDTATYFDALKSIKSRLYEEKNARS
jgi:hypothetical protein